MILFNAENGYLDGIVRGYRSELITTVQYASFIQCDTLEGNLRYHPRVDLRAQLVATPAFGEQELAAGEVISPSLITKRLCDKFAEQFRYLHTNSTGQMKRFIEFITYSYQIDNVVLLISGTLHGYEKEELLERCHPLGMFEALPAITVASTSNEIYHTVLAESALGPYFKHCLSADDLDEMHVEVIRGTLTRTYLEHFISWIKSECDEKTAETMNDLLSFEADRRILNIVLSTMGTGLSTDTKLGLFPRFGRLWETGVVVELANAEDMTAFRNALNPCPEYRLLFPEDEDSKSPTGIADPSAYSERSLEEQLAEREVTMCKLAFAYHFTFTPLYAWTRLKEQELRNVRWIAECIAQKQKQHIAHYIATN